MSINTPTDHWYVDTREPSAIKKLLKKYDIPFEEVNLPFGDMVLGDIVIERKTIIDLMNSLKDNRIWKQLKELQLSEATPILLIELRGKEYWKYLHILGAITTYCARHNIHVIVTYRRKDLVNALKQLMGMSKRSINLKKKWKGYPTQLLILTQFPSVGIKTAKKLLDMYGSLKNIFNQDVENLSKVIGPKTAERFIHILEERVA